MTGLGHLLDLCDSKQPSMLWCACRLRTRIAARQAVPTVLAAPDIAVIRIANENVAAGFCIDAVIEDVNFNSASDLVLLEVNGERVKRRRG